MVKDYWRRVHRRALPEAAKAIGVGSWLGLLIGGVGVILALASLAFWGSADASRDEAIARSALAACVILLFPFVYF